MFGMSPEELKKTFQDPVSQEEETLLPQIGPKYERRPGGLYEVMLKKLAPYAIKGFIWYQGESDDQKAELYGTVFSSLIRCWRNLWEEDLPFLFVQLAPFRQWLDCVGSRYPELRAQQEWVSEHITGTGMAVITDAGMEWDIHPKVKRYVGERLALLARGKVYGEDILCEAPKLVSAELENGKLTLGFANAEGGLVLNGSNVNALEIIQNGENVTEYTCTILGTKVILKNNVFELEKSIEVNLACMDYYEVNLYNKAGIPARPGKIVI
jgi:sialate O-acetylesterase